MKTRSRIEQELNYAEESLQDVRDAAMQMLSGKKPDKATVADLQAALKLVRLSIDLAQSVLEERDIEYAMDDFVQRALYINMSAADAAASALGRFEGTALYTSG